MTDKIEYTKGSGNVFADLGLDNPEELMAKSTLAMLIKDIIKKRGLTQVKAAKLLETHQTQISRLKNSKGINTISLDLLMHWLTKLGRNITVSVNKVPKSQENHDGRIQVAI